MPVIVQNPKFPSYPQRLSRAGINRLSSLTQAMDLQAIAFTTAQSPDVPAHIKAALMRAWVDLEEIRLTLKGYGRPKPVEARNAHTAKRKPRASGPVSPPKQEPPADPSTA